MNEQTQYKYLPSEPTEEMIKSLPPFLYRGYEALVKSSYKSMWQAAPAVEQGPVAWHDKENNDVRSREVEENEH